MNNFSCGCLFDKKIKEPHFKKTRHFEDLSASFAINAKNEQLRAHYSWLVQMHRPLKNVPHPYIEATLENPSDKANPIVVPAIQLQNNDAANAFPHPRYYILSPSLPELHCGLYKMRLTAYTDKTKQQVLAEHDNELLSRINTDTCYKSEFMERMNAIARETEQDWEKRN